MNHVTPSRRAAPRTLIKPGTLATAVSATIALLLAMPAQAQSTSEGGTGTGSGMMGNRSSLLPYTVSGYVGVNGGVSDYSAGDCTLTFDCDDTDQAFKVYTGGLINQWLGAELSYLHMGTVDRNGGNVRAYGVNASLVGNIPVTDQFMVYAKGGVTYGRTRTTAPLGAPSGTESGWGPSWGVGVGYKFTPQWAVVLDYDQHRFDFAGGRDRVSATSIGVRFNF